MTEVILVNEKDEILGSMEKMEAHRKGLLHRAFSVFIFNDNKELLLQKRAIEKYHSGGLWTNTCCSHPIIGDTIENSAIKRLEEEMGFKTELSYLTHFIYKASLDNEMIEHELDHIYTGFYNGFVSPNPDEVCEWKYVSMNEIEIDIETNPNHYTEWFKLIFEKVNEYITKI